jgi:hypothetical protein
MYNLIHSGSYKNFPSCTNESFHMGDLDEVRGDLFHVEEADGGCLALIGKIPVLLPPEMISRLAGLVGKRIGVLRVDQSYRLKVIEGRR